MVLGPEVRSCTQVGPADESYLDTVDHQRHCGPTTLSRYTNITHVGRTPVTAGRSLIGVAGPPGNYPGELVEGLEKV